MMLLGPIIHGRKVIFRVVYGNVGALCEDIELIIGYNGSDFKNHMDFRIESTHFQVYPYQAVAQFSLQGVSTNFAEGA
jgi:hypothetical protein